jgi:hypothetical protein
MSEPTDEAMRAAHFSHRSTEADGQERDFVEVLTADLADEVLEDDETLAEEVNDIGPALQGMIDRTKEMAARTIGRRRREETNLPALKAENARLREALIEVRNKLQSLSHPSMDRAVYIGVGIALSTICEALATSDE